MGKLFNIWILWMLFYLGLLLIDLYPEHDRVHLLIGLWVLVILGNLFNACEKNEGKI